MNATAPILVASDLDGTLIPAHESPDSGDGIHDLVRALDDARDSLVLAYVTGRHKELALDGVRAWGLPRPDVLVCDVGTTLYRWESGAFRDDEAYAGEMRRAMGGTDAEALRGALSQGGTLTLQEPARQGRFKASFTFSWEERDRARSIVRSVLDGLGADAEVVVSRDAHGVGLMDLLPAGGAKDRSLAYLGGALGLSPDQVVFAGDSGNDVRALLCGVRGILVGNAPDDVRAHLREEARRRGLHERVYFADEPVAAGVLEGLRHFRVLRASSKG